MILLHCINILSIIYLEKNNKQIILPLSRNQIESYINKYYTSFHRQNIFDACVTLCIYKKRRFNKNLLISNVCHMIHKDTRLPCCCPESAYCKTLYGTWYGVMVWYENFYTMVWYNGMVHKLIPWYSSVVWIMVWYGIIQLTKKYKKCY